MRKIGNNFDRLQYPDVFYNNSSVKCCWKALTIFIPSRRRIEFLQKNITQLNVEFKDPNVFDNRLNNKNCLSDNDVLDAKRKATYIMYGQKQQKKQSTAKEHVEILLRFKVAP
jgi:hypothetical protein